MKCASLKTLDRRRKGKPPMSKAKQRKLLALAKQHRTDTDAQYAPNRWR